MKSFRNHNKKSKKVQCDIPPWCKNASLGPHQIQEVSQPEQSQKKKCKCAGFFFRFWHIRAFIIHYNYPRSEESVVNPNYDLSASITTPHIRNNLLKRIPHHRLFLWRQTSEKVLFFFKNLKVVTFSRSSSLRPGFVQTCEICHLWKITLCWFDL